MKEVLSQLNSVPGMVGSMVCDEHGHMLAHLFPPTFDASMLESAASVLTDNAPALHEYTGGLKVLDFRCENGRVVVKPVNEGYFVLLCLNSVNMQLLNMTIKVASKMLEKAGKSVNERTIEAPIIQLPKGPKQSLADLMAKGPMAASLTGMQTALAKFLGPIAKIVFVECVEKWIETNPPTKETLPELINLINQEINDHQNAGQYMQMVIPFL